jgi:hypothetical protein
VANPNIISSLHCRTIYLSDDVTDRCELYLLRSHEADLDPILVFPQLLQEHDKSSIRHQTPDDGDRDCLRNVGSFQALHVAVAREGFMKVMYSKSDTKFSLFESEGNSSPVRPRRSNGGGGGVICQTNL